jgi:hypothetical protein
MIQTVEIDEKMKLIKKENQSYRFIKPENLLPEMLTDPDYRLKYLQRQFGNMNPISCSKCHHCR